MLKRSRQLMAGLLVVQVVAISVHEFAVLVGDIIERPLEGSEPTCGHTPGVHGRGTVRDRALAGPGPAMTGAAVTESGLIRRRWRLTDSCARPVNAVLDHAPLERVTSHVEEFRCLDDAARLLERQGAQKTLGGFQVVGFEGDRRHVSVDSGKRGPIPVMSVRLRAPAQGHRG